MLSDKDICPVDKNGQAHGYCKFHLYESLISKGLAVHGRKFGIWEEYVYLTGYYKKTFYAI